jgi:PIN domain nuclease of toxin-antitoxin system
MAESIGLEKCRASFVQMRVVEAMRISLDERPFHRIITTTAMIHQAPLLTKEEMIRRE